MRRGLFLLALLGSLALAVGGCPLVAPVENPGRPGGYTTAPSPGPATTTDNSGGQSGGTGGVTVSGGSAVGPPVCLQPLEADRWRSEVLRLVNVERATYGLRPLTWNATLETLATQYACEMIQGGFFAHENPLTGSTLADRVQATDYQYWMLGENLAAGQTTPTRVMQDWMSSPNHRENILNPGFTELGVGVLTGGEYKIYWVQLFGRPHNAGPYQE